MTFGYVKMTSSHQDGPSAKAILQRLGLSPRKALGQHFLVGQGVLVRILKAAEIGEEDMVVEVGPGLGMLTRRLAQQAKRVITVEMDRGLAEALEQELSSYENLEVVCADGREVAVEEMVGEEPYKLVANLPFYAASPILRRFLESGRPPVRAVVMVQREVARRMVAKPGDMSLVSVGTQLYGHPKIVGYVPPSAFYPQPKVTSAIVRIDVYPRPAVDLDDRDAFFALVRAGFSAPRKQLRNALGQGLGIPPKEAGALLESSGIDPRRRPETVSLEEWGVLYQQARKGSVNAGSGVRQD